MRRGTDLVCSVPTFRSAVGDDERWGRAALYERKSGVETVIFSSEHYHRVGMFGARTRLGPHKGDVREEHCHEGNECNDLGYPPWAHDIVSQTRTVCSNLAPNSPIYGNGVVVIDPRDVLRPFVHRVVRDYLNLPPDGDLQIDADGDIPIRWGSAMYYVSLLERDPVLVRVWSIVLKEVERTDELLAEINDINSSIVACRVFFTENRLVAATELRADTMDPGELEFACWAIGSLADWIDTTLAVRFGGTKHFADTDDLS